VVWTLSTHFKNMSDESKAKREYVSVLGIRLMRARRRGGVCVKDASDEGEVKRESARQRGREYLRSCGLNAQRLC
jgi:hypothetical protein